MSSDLLLRPHLRRRQEDRLEGRRRRLLAHHPLQPGAPEVLRRAAPRSRRARSSPPPSRSPCRGARSSASSTTTGSTRSSPGRSPGRGLPVPAPPLRAGPASLPAGVAVRALAPLAARARVPGERRAAARRERRPPRHGGGARRGVSRPAARPGAMGSAALLAAGCTAVPLLAVATVLFSEPLFLVLLVGACWAADAARGAAPRPALAWPSPRAHSRARRRSPARSASRSPPAPS